MIGLHFTTVSPSSSSATRSTPWVEGCCGPMFSVMVSLRTVFHFLGFQARERRRRDLAPRRVVSERHLFVAERRILAQRPAYPVLGQQDPAGIGEPGELDSEEIPGPARMPVGGGPHPDHGRHARMLLAHLHLEVHARDARD